MSEQNLKEEISKELSVRMFTALADETPDPEVEVVNTPITTIDGDDTEVGKEWIPYQGPMGGEGWQDASNPDDVRYTEDAPGEVVDEYEEMAEDWGTSEPDSSDGIPDIELTTATNEEFAGSVDDFIEANPEKGAFLTAHTPEELEDSTLISAEGVDGGVAVTDGDIQNLHKNEGPSGAGRAMLEEAIDQGGRTLDCYDGFLRRTYQTHGFREVGRMEFNPEFAPDGWNFDKYGQPDVVFMAFQPNEPVEQTDDYYAGDEWGEAKDKSRDVANWNDRMEEKDNEIDIPDDEQDVIEQMEEDKGEELTEQEKNLAIAQAELIGDL